MLEFFRLIFLIEDFEAYYQHANFVQQDPSKYFYGTGNFIGNAIYTANSSIFEHDLGLTFTLDKAKEIAKDLCASGLYIKNDQSGEFTFYPPARILKARIIKNAKGEKEK